MEIGEEDDAVETLRDLHIGDGVDGEVQERLTLGFVEMPRSKWSLARQLFPSKAGGVPAWLDPHNLPSGRSRLCDVCGERLQFLLQVYALTSDRESTFRRTLYLFACPSMSCLRRDKCEQWRRPVVNASRSVKVFRSQSPHDNPFYSTEPPQHDGSDKPLGNGGQNYGTVDEQLYFVTGVEHGKEIKCGSCREARYCSRRLQATHSRSGRIITCQNSSKNVGISSAEEQKPASRSLWPEYEINEDGGEYDVCMFADDGDQMDDATDALIVRMQGYSDTRSWGNFQECIATGARASFKVVLKCPL